MDTSKLGKIPYIYFDNLDYTFKFAGRTHKVSQKNHNQDNYRDALIYAKRHAQRVFYVHHLKRGRLPRIRIEESGDSTFKFIYTIDGEKHNGVIVLTKADIHTDEYTRAFDAAIVSLLGSLGVRGIL